jgi:hypothetical protein
MKAIILFVLVIALASCNIFTPKPAEIPVPTVTSLPPTLTFTPAPAITPTSTEKIESVVTLSIKVPTAGNSWVENNIEETVSVITDQGISNWQISSGKIVTYVYLPQTGELDIALDARVPVGSSTIEVTVGAVSKTVTLTNTSLQQVYVGRFLIDNAGYARITMEGIAATTEIVAEVPNITIGGSATRGVNGGAAGSDDTYFIKDEFYWGRRGPSVHLFYQLPTDEPIEWFYSELTVPTGQDVIGSYYVANGFSEGYFGIQVNSLTERRVLFSVWSPYQTDDPSAIPEEYRIQPRRTGEGVIINEFGNEGSGGQSYLPYLWQAGQTYGFLLKVTPAENNSTNYTAYFYAPEQGKWSLIASFRRPKTTTYLTRPYAFLENFLPETGQFSRRARYGNQWVRTKDGQWLEITKASFSYDDTATRKSRWDYQGGVEDGQFYLKNCGFFSEFTIYGTLLERPAHTAPDIDLTQLP